MGGLSPGEWPCPAAYGGGPQSRPTLLHPPPAFSPCPPSSSSSPGPCVLSSASIFVLLSPVPPPEASASSLASGHQGFRAEEPRSRGVTLVAPGSAQGPSEAPAAPQAPDTVGGLSPWGWQSPEDRVGLFFLSFFFSFPYFFFFQVATSATESIPSSYEVCVCVCTSLRLPVHTPAGAWEPPGLGLVATCTIKGSPHPPGSRGRKKNV